MIRSVQVILETLITLRLGCVIKMMVLRKQRLFVMLGSIFNTAVATSLRKIPLSMDNNLPSTVLKFVSSDDNEIAFSCHLDSCTAMNNGNSLLHMRIKSTYSKIVESYERYDDIDLFQPTTLDCDVPSSVAEKIRVNYLL